MPGVCTYCRVIKTGSVGCVGQWRSHFQPVIFLPLQIRPFNKNDTLEWEGELAESQITRS